MKIGEETQNRQCVEGLGGLREDLKNLERGVSPGCGGLRNEFIMVLADKMGSSKTGSIVCG